MDKSKLTVDERIRILKRNSINNEKFCHEKLGMPILTEGEKKIQRKKLYEEIMKKYKGKKLPPFDAKKSYDRVKKMIKLLENDCKDIS